MMMTTATSLMPAAALKVRHHYHSECEAAVDSDAALELHKSFQCLARACSLHHHPNVALKQWVAMPSSRGSSQPRDQIQVSHIAGGFFPI